MNYNELSKRVHAAAKANGWYDTEQSINTYLALIKSEIYEAFDAFRSNKYTKLPFNRIVELKLQLKDLSIATNVFQDQFKYHIKDTFEDEIADTAIRILDFCGWYGIELGPIIKIDTKPYGKFDLDLVYMDQVISSCYDKEVKEMISLSFSYLLGALESIAKIYNFNLEQHINLKLAYNATRGYKHGNKVL